MSADVPGPPPQPAPSEAPARDPAAPPSAAAEGAAPQDAPKHLYDAIATQRDHTLGAYDTQKAAIVQAVAEQREAMVQPVRNVQARQATTAGLAGGARIPPLPARQHAVAADIVATLKALIADEVRSQVHALLDAAVMQRQPGQNPAGAPRRPAPAAQAVDGRETG